MRQALQEHRRRLAERGMKRVEVCVRPGDVDLIRKVAKILVTDKDSAVGLRAAIGTVMPSRTTLSFKEWLSASSAESENWHGEG